MSNIFQSAVVLKHSANKLMNDAFNKSLEGAHGSLVKKLYDQSLICEHDFIFLTKKMKNSKASNEYFKSVKGFWEKYEEQEKTVTAYITCFEENESHE